MLFPFVLVDSILHSHGLYFGSLFEEARQTLFGTAFCIIKYFRDFCLIVLCLVVKPNIPKVLTPRVLYFLVLSLIFSCSMYVFYTSSVVYFLSPSLLLLIHRC